MNNVKAFYKSKSFWTGVIIPVVTMFIPGATDWIKANPEAFATLTGALFIILRLVTNGAIGLTDSPAVQVDPGATNGVGK